jgi:NAD(P)-dependent dehydrogenase (short-subunit alcohol dehydrogenase family)
MKLKGKVAVVTGSGQGIGKAIAISLAEKGIKVVVNNRSPRSTGGTAEETARAIAEAGGEAIAVYGDVSQIDICEKLINTAINKWGTIDILINNAGINRDRMVWNMNEEDWDAVMAVNLKGTFGCTKFAVPHMRQQRSGRIINIASQAGLDGNAYMPAYSAAKAGIVGFTKSCALALGRYGITVNALCPQADTRMWRSATFEQAREMGVLRGLVTPEEVTKIPEDEVYTRVFGSTMDIAPIAVYLASNEAASINGQVFFATKGRIGLYGPWTQMKSLDKKGRWTVEELSTIIPSWVSGDTIK